MDTATDDVTPDPQAVHDPGRTMPMQSRVPPTCAECDPRLFMPADPLTRLMMGADDISVSEMDALMQRVSRALATRWAGCGEVTD